jgi:hypothetical protein
VFPKAGAGLSRIDVVPRGLADAFEAEAADRPGVVGDGGV